MSTMEMTNRNSYEKDMYKDGVIILKNLIDSAQIEKLEIEINNIQSIIMPMINRMDRPLKTYSDIAERHLGRLDFRCGFAAQIFADVGQTIFDLIKIMSPTITFRFYWGAIPSLAGSGSTDMHRDIYPILNTTKGMNLGDYDVNLPPYYFTVLIPLTEITQENGPTQFIKGSHRRKIVSIDEECFTPFLSPGDIIIFDGRTMHKGLANHSKTERLIAYMTFVANWYHDQTFTMNNYLFPELAQQGSA